MLSNDELTKKCACCKEVKPISEFGKSSRTVDGLYYRCKECNNKQIREYRKRLKEENPEVYQRRIKVINDYKEKNKERIKEKDKLKYIKNRNKIKARTQMLRAKGYLDDERLGYMLDFFDYKCAYSGEKLNENYIIEHIVPLSKGGYNFIWNMVPAAFIVNASKHDKEVFEWYSQKEYFDKKRWIKIAEWQYAAYEKYKDDINKININNNLE